MKRIITTLAFTFCALFLNAQTLMKKTLQATRINEKINIDGNLKEGAWANVPIAKDFLFRWPTPGKAATEQTEVKVMYDDYAIYVGAHLLESQPDSIMKSLTKRDNNGNCDWFFITFDTYMDGQNGLGFGVTTANVQFDMKYSIANANQNNGDDDGEDINWDAVWKSAVQMSKDGWYVEMEIPYSALRFPKKAVQNWHINFMRRIFRKGETDSWNEIKPTEKGSLRQSGILQGIENIKMPLRLQATPFLALYGENYHDNNANPKNVFGRSFNAGMDLKYGINEAFTLDATIIPDFGQVRSDNQIVNLSPFEVRFDEFRPFFMEGTELFNKGGLFYSRRIGGRPINRWKINEEIKATEEVVSNPTKTQLYNSTKISGRTKLGTGIGVLNAVQAPTFATLKDTETGKERDIETSPLTNYNVTVFDQNLKYNSSIALINTNVWRAGSTYDANVTGLNWNLKNKPNSYSLTGNFALSQLYKEKPVYGHKMNIDVNKLSGKLTWGASYSEVSDKYNQGDMGYQSSYNYRNYNVWGGFFEPNSKHKKWNNYWINTWAWYTTLQQANNFTESGIGINIGGNTKKFRNMGINFNFFPWGENDYFEPRTFDFKTYYHLRKVMNSNIWFNSDNRKKFRYWAGFWGRIFKNTERWNNNLWGGMSYQLNKKFRLSFDFQSETGNNDVGFAFERPNAVDYDKLKSGDILFGKRNITGLDNGLSFTYTFNNKANLSFRARHYWQQVRYYDFYLLQEKGEVKAIPYYNGLDSKGMNAHNINANFFNIDCIFTWRFAPGSDIFITWKNAIYNEDQAFLEYNYFGNATRMFNQPQTNSLNIKVLYFIDYVEMKRKFKK